jgi:hypothetical protein
VRTPVRALFIAGSLMMFLGIAAAGFIYRDMRAERLLHEPLRVFRIDPSRDCAWQSSPISIFQNGAHAVVLSISDPGTGSAKAQSGAGPPYKGAVEIVVENPRGNVALNARAADFPPGIVKPDRLLWYPVATLVVEGISGSEWKIQSRFTAGDPAFAGSLAEIIVIPPHPEEFVPYLEHAALRLYAAGGVLLLGFLVVVVGGRYASSKPA